MDIFDAPADGQVGFVAEICIYKAMFIQFVFVFKSSHVNSQF
jgi:hypothetical protein